MADQRLLGILRRGPKEWNSWRKTYHGFFPDLSGADLSGATLSGADLSGVSLGEANLARADLAGANLRNAALSSAKLNGAHLGGADLSDTTLTNANLSDADLGGVAGVNAKFVGALLVRANLARANLRNADLDGTDLSDVDLRSADLRGARLERALLQRTNLGGTNLEHALLGRAVFAEMDLSEAKGLESITHWRPSEIGIGTIYQSSGDIPESFLRGCGVPENFITYMRSLTAVAIEFYSCFISYSGKDEDFAKRLHSRMREAELRVWFAPEDIKGGDKLFDQIDRAIQVHDRLLLVLSEHSLHSKWVETEIRRARKAELNEGRRKLFPIRLVSYEALQGWTCIDSATGEDLAEEVRGYFIPDFSNWKSHDELEKAFARLLADLKASA